ncbi:MAG: hypothetical protein A2W23_05260 [Planctomycetes bacterium RBG_16_43_13]|nr:MAG: hypothetical protein A2W23_05260 [Planctomycetes bacterium RBG_16_43_13]
MNTEIKRDEQLQGFLLSTMGGTVCRLKDFRGRKILLFCWASWSASREYLPVLQSFYDKYRDRQFEVVSIAFDVQGPGFPMRYIKKYDIDFVTLIDADVLLSRLYGIKTLPFSVLLDENGYVMLTAEEPSNSFLAKVEDNLDKTVEHHSRKEQKVKCKSNEVELLMQSCANLLGRGRKQDAIGKLRSALTIDRDNEIIKNQILVIENPEKFYPKSSNL